MLYITNMQRNLNSFHAKIKVGFVIISALILNLPQNITAPEDTAGGTVVFELTLLNPFVQYTFAFDPPETADFFEVNNVGK